MHLTEHVPAVRANRAHRYAIANALHKLLACARQGTDKVENALVKEYFTDAGSEAVLDLVTQNAFKELVAASQNPSRVVIWEVQTKYNEGARTVAQGTAAELSEFLMHFIG